jgi:hypothetical protein
LAEYAPVVFGGCVMAFVVDYQANLPAVQDSGEPALVKGADRADQNPCLCGSTFGAPFDRNNVLSSQGGFQLLARLQEQFFPVCEHEHLFAGESGQFRKNDCFSSTGWQAYEYAAHPLTPGSQNRSDAFLLVGTQGDH